MSIYIALMARTDQVRVSNRATFRHIGKELTSCIVVTGMLPTESWEDTVKVKQLEMDVQSECEEFGEVLACVVPSVGTSRWSHQIFIAFKHPKHAKRALKHFGQKMTTHGDVSAEVLLICKHCLF